MDGFSLFIDNISFFNRYVFVITAAAAWRGYWLVLNKDGAIRLVVAAACMKNSGICSDIVGLSVYTSLPIDGQPIIGGEIAFHSQGGAAVNGYCRQRGISVDIHLRIVMQLNIVIGKEVPFHLKS